MDKAAKEQAKENKRFEKSLIRAPKGAASLGIRSYGDDGLICLTDGGYVKIYRASSLEVFDPDMALYVRNALSGHTGIRLRYTCCYAGGGEPMSCYITIFCEARDGLIAKADIEAFQKELASVYALSSLGMDEVRTAAERIFGDRRRKKKDKGDWLLALGEAGETADYFAVGADLGRAYQLLGSSAGAGFYDLMCITDLGFEGVIAIDMQSLSAEDTGDYKRLLELHSSRQIATSDNEALYSMSVSFLVRTDSHEALSVIEKTVAKRLTERGFVFAASFGRQKRALYSMSTFGLIGDSHMQIVKEDAIGAFIPMGGLS